MHGPSPSRTEPDCPALGALCTDAGGPLVDDEPILECAREIDAAGVNR